MNRKLIAAVVSGALVLPVAALAQDEEAMEVPEHSHPSVLEHEHELGEGEEMMMAPMHGHSYASHPAAAHEHDASHGHSATVYGNLRFGVQMDDSDGSNDARMWDLGANKGSRFGIKGSMEAGEGLTAGFHLERAVNAALGKRLHNVYLSGGFGTVTFGQQNGPYYGATSWDNSQALGGLTDFVDDVNASSRASGVSFMSNLGGPFSFHAMASSGAGGAEGTGDGANNIQVSGNLNAGPVALTVGYQDNDDADERIGGTVAGSLAAVSWKVGYDSGTDAGGAGVDDDRYGFHVGYGIGDGNAYVQFSDMDSDDNAKDTDGWVFGYSHVLAKNVVVYAEHATSDNQDVTSTSTVFAVKVGF
jgi:predicted porin